MFTLAVVFWASCGGRVPPPERRVIEGDVGGWRFRRYQAVVDVEVYVDGNPARAHTASYVRDSAVRAGHLTEADVVSAFVTEYTKRDGVRVALIRFARRLAQESGYRVEERKIGGERVFPGKYVVKVGGHGPTEVPGSLVGEYGRRYPSEITAESHATGLDEERKR
jgi:hypothetical protein